GRGDAAGTLKAGALVATVGAVKAGEVAVQSLGFEAVAALGSGNTAFEAVSTAGQAPFYVGVGKSGYELTKTAALPAGEDKRRRLIEQGTDLAAQAVPIAGAALAKQPAARTVKPDKAGALSLVEHPAADSASIDPALPSAAQSRA